LSDRGWPAVSGQVNVTVTAPDETVFTLKLHDDGTHGDVTAGDGTWTNRFVQTSVPGVYRFLFRSTGKNERGELAPREATRYVTLAQLEPTPEDEIGDPGGVSVASYLIGTYDLRNARSVLHVLNPTARDLGLRVVFFDDDGRPLRCISERLTANDMLEIDVGQAEPGEKFGIVKILATEPRSSTPAIGIVGNQRLFFERGGITETSLHPVPDAILREDLKRILSVCR
jgi:hypothetical protein